MKYAIVVDSGCDLKEIDGDEAGFFRAPLILNVGDREFVDDFSLDVTDFMKEMTAYGGKTGSAAPSPGVWQEMFDKAEEVFAFTITGTLSGSYASAMTARNVVAEKNPDKKIYIMDTCSAGPELTLMVEKTLEYIRNGMTFEEIVTGLAEYKKRTKLVFALSSLDNLIKNGRVSKLKGGMAGLLGIKILGYASESGTLEILKKCRGKLSVYDSMIEEMIRCGYRGGKVIISHCFNSEKAEYLTQKIKEKFPKSRVVTMPTSGLCSYYAEKQGILLGFEGK